MKNQRPTRSFRGAFAIVGYLIQMTNPPLDPTVPMRKIGPSWMNFIRSTLLSIIMKFFADLFAQISAQGHVLVPGRRSPTAHHRSDDLHTFTRRAFVGLSPLQDGYHTRVPSRCHHCGPPSPRPSDAVPGRCDAAAPATASSTAECSWDAADHGNTDLDAAAVEEDALCAERTTNAHLFQRQFTTTGDSHLNCDHPFCSSEFPAVIPNADSNQWSNKPYAHSSVSQWVGGIALVFDSCTATRLCHIIRRSTTRWRVRCFPLHAYEANPITPSNFDS